MKTKTVGELLLAERQKRQASIPDISVATKIQARFIESLEKNQFDQLPAAVFVKGFIKSLAQHYQQDPQPLLATLRRDFKESATGQLVPREFIRPFLKKQLVWSPLTTTFLLFAVVFLTLFSYVLLQWYNFQKPPLLTVSVPEENSVLKEKFRVAGRTMPEAIVTINTQPVSLFPDGRFETDFTIPREGTHILTIEATDRRGKTNVVQRLIRVQPNN